MAYTVTSRTRQVSPVVQLSPIANLIDLVAIALGVGFIGLAAYGVLVLFG